MRYRKAQLADVPAMVRIAQHSVSIDPLPVKQDPARMAEMLTQIVASPAHFAMVAEDADGIHGAIAALTMPSFWFRGMSCSVLLYHCTKPGGSAALIRRFARWLPERHNIKTAIFELEPGADPKLQKVIEKLGFGRVSTNVSYVRAPS